MTFLLPHSVYIHIPFCQSICTYCAFNTYAAKQTYIPSYIESVCRELAVIQHWDMLPKAHTLYFGGGTPSLLSPQQIAKLVDTVSHYYDLADQAEITLELNPESVSIKKLIAYHSLGVNRISIGVQSAHDETLQLFGRRHSFRDAQRAFDLGRQAGFTNISVDLIYSAPNQTLGQWADTLTSVLEWEPDHFSIYALILEPGTSMTKRIEKGSLPAPEDDLAADMYDLTKDLLKTSGYVHYEISTWARPGYESKHNKQYWLNEPFLGFGAGAYGMANHTRYWTIHTLQEYSESLKEFDRKPVYPFSPALEGFETIDPPTEIAETAILQLRLVQEGINRRRFMNRHGLDIYDFYQVEFDDLNDKGLLEITDEHIRLTERAHLISNYVFGKLLPDVSV